MRRWPPKRACTLRNSSRRSATGSRRATFIRSSQACCLPRFATSRSMLFMNRSSACGTSSIMLILRSCIVFSSIAGCRLVTKEMLAPQPRPANSDPICSNMWLSGSRLSMRNEGSPGITCCTECRLAIRLPCVSSTPLASPVVPEVNMISARSSPPRDAGGAAGRPYISPSRSSNRIAGTSSAPSPPVAREVNASTGAVLATTWRTKSAVERRSRGTRIAPMRRHPKNANTQCGAFGPHSTTRSPLPTPRLCNSAATCAAASRSSR